MGGLVLIWWPRSRGPSLRDTVLLSFKSVSFYIYTI